MAQPTEYKRTLFDRLGPDAGLLLRAVGAGVLVFGVAVAALILKVGFSVTLLLIGVAAGIATGAFTFYLAHGVGSVVRAVAFDGAGTPYREQFSYQQALVMQGKVDDAIASFEALIVEHPHDVDIRIRAAELCAREKRDAARAADFFRAAQKLASISPGEEIYVTNRLVDLYIGPLNNPGRALIELRRLIDRYPGSPMAINAQAALTTIKARIATPS
jgi:tetratricopeptide (TPR) repeat protein